MDAAKLVEEQQTIFRFQSERNLFLELEKGKSEAVKGTIQVLHNKGLFDSFENEELIFNEYLTFTY